ncbi:hypothetical protein P7C73_g6500, partial [Tremellales sp. Uapishka_1]
MTIPPPPSSLSLKLLLSAGQALLQPPGPLPSFPPELLQRLSAASAVLPLEWRSRHQGWEDDSELEQVGDASEDIRTRKGRRDELLLIVGQRCLSLVDGMQHWLQREFWPVEFKDGHDTKDFLLGTADLRLLRLLLSHTMASYLLPQSVAYLDRIAAQTSPAATSLAAALVQIHHLLHIVPPPVSSGPSKGFPSLPTIITQTLLTSHLAPIILSTVLLSYTPTTPPAVHAGLRKTLLAVLASLPPTQSIASLGAVLRLLQLSKNGSARGWMRKWPGYIGDAVGALMSAQMRRTGGVRALMENMFGEAGNLSDGDAAEGEKLDRVAGVLSKIPKNTSVEAYLSYLLPELFDLIFDQSAHPLIYTHSASYTVSHLHNIYPAFVSVWLRETLHAPWLPPKRKAGLVTPYDSLERSARLVNLLIMHSPPSAGYTSLLVSPILPGLFSIFAFLAASDTAGLRARPASPVALGKKPQISEARSLEQEIEVLLLTWGRIVAKDVGVQGIWDIVTSRSGLGTFEDGEMFWKKDDGKVGLYFGIRESADLPEISFSGLEDENDLLQHIELSPNPKRLAALLKKLDRLDIASEVFLKVLTEWRIRSETDHDPMTSLLYVQLTLSMMESFGETLMTEPEQILVFVEGVLGDEVCDLQRKEKPMVEVLNEEEQNSTGDIDKMGMVETAITLLLASLEADENVNQTTSPILYPINSHLTTLSTSSPSAQVRRLAQEALLVMLVRRAAALAANTAQSVSPAITTYRRALTLIADPILPVRAHGLMLLKDLVLSKDYDTALTPAIMDIFMQSLLEVDSYIYLNAVKGLAGMVDALGRDVFRALVRAYRESMEKDDRDKVLRIAEALNMIIQRAGKGVSAFADQIIPVLSSTFPNTQLPTIIRTSALSVLSTCAETDYLSLLPWSADLVDAALDLMQIETIVSLPFRPAPPAEVPQPKHRKVVLVDDESDEVEPEPAELGPRIVDEDPVAKQDSKHPALRRAAVVFLGLLLASNIESRSGRREPLETDTFQMRTRPEALARPADTPFPTRLLRRAETVLTYVAQTDVDEVFRGQAGEVVALVQRLAQISISGGFSSELDNLRIR